MSPYYHIYMKKLSTICPFIIGVFVFATLAAAPRVFADVGFSDPSSFTLPSPIDPVEFSCSPSVTTGGIVLLKKSDALVALSSGNADTNSPSWNTIFVSANGCILPVMNTGQWNLVVAEGDGVDWVVLNLGSALGGGFYAVNWAAVLNFVDSSTGFQYVPPDFSTHFNDLILATTTQTVRLTGYISPTDFASSSPIRIDFNVATPLYSQWDHDFVIATTSGEFSHEFIYQNFSTSTIDVFIFSGVLSSPSEGDIFNNIGVVEHIYDTISLSVTSDGIGVTTLPSPADVDLAIAENCNPFSSFFAIARCISYLVFPNKQQVESNITQLRDGFLSRVPIGYVTRFVSILTNTATTTLPAISYTFSSTSPFYQGGSPYSFTPFAYVNGSGTLLNDARSDQSDPKSLWAIVEQITKIIVYLMLVFMIIHDLTGIHRHHPHQSNKKHE